MTKYLVIDTETSGLPRFDLPAEAPEQPHIASIAMIYATGEGDAVLTVERETYALIKPTGWELEPGAAAVNGLTMEMLETDGRPIVELMAEYAEAIDDDRVIVAFNAQFDCKMCRGALRRLGMDDRFERTRNLCTMRGASAVMKLAPPEKMMAAGYKTNKMPKLAEAYEYFIGEPLTGAHHALSDAHACLAVFAEMMRRGCAPAPDVHRAKEGTKAGAAFAARQGQGATP